MACQERVSTAFRAFRTRVVLISPDYVIGTVCGLTPTSYQIGSLPWPSAHLSIVSI